MRFRTKEVALMCHHVKIPDSQISFLRYLWQNNNDLNGELVDYEMGVHVFGGTSSPEYCIYAVRRTAIDNAPNYDTEVAETLLNNSIVTLLF